LPRLVTPFALGLGGRFGDGRQWMSWIGLKDLVAVADRVLTTSGFRGPINTVAPEPVRNREFAAALAAVLARPSWLTVPAPALRMMMGEMGGELLLASQRVVPTRLSESGFEFRQPTLKEALQGILEVKGRG